MKPEALPQDLAAALGLPNLAFDAEGRARLIYEGKVDIELALDAEAGELHLTTDLAEMPSADGEALYIGLLQANLRGQQTLGATLAVDEAAHMIVLNRTVMTSELAAGDLLDLVQRFCASAMYWTTTLAATMPAEKNIDLPSLFAAAMAGAAEEGPAAAGGAQAPGFPAYVRG